MPAFCLVKTSEYHDSVSLMLTARELARLPGVSDAAVVMGTDANKAILREAGLLDDLARSAGANDLVIAVSAAQEVGKDALAAAEALLRKKTGETASEGFRPKTVRGAVKANPAANVAVVSVAGRYAAAQAWDALGLGLHVLLFSDNVSLEDEIALKQYAVAHGLLMMGPGAGTAILNGVALGFANATPTGPVGVVSAAGTGLQEVTTQLARRGVGVTQGIGTGGRDLKEAVGGLMMLAGLRALQDDPTTGVILLVSKPPAAEIVAKLLAQIAHSRKTTVICMLGGHIPAESLPGQAIWARTLEEAAYKAASAAGANLPDWVGYQAEQALRLEALAGELVDSLHPGQRYLRGLYSGGTLCYEAQVIWQAGLPEPVMSNAPLKEENLLADSTRSQGHTAVDLGEEEFTVGRPHPMIDNDLRIRRLYQEASDPATAVILLDFVLGFGAHPNPAGELAPAIRRAAQEARQAGRELIFLAAITGTAGDPQDLELQADLLRDAGVILLESNAAAARLAAKIVAKAGSRD